MAERDATIHAAGTLPLDLLFRKRNIHLEPVFDALGGREPLGDLPCCIHESGYLPHSKKSEDRSQETESQAVAASNRGTPSTRLYSCGNTFTNCPIIFGQFSRIHLARGLPVAATCREISS